MKCFLLCLALLNTSLLSMEIDKAKSSLEIELKLKLSPQDMNVLCEDVKFNDLTTMNETYLFGPAIQPQNTNGYLKMSQYVRIRQTKNGNFITAKKRDQNGVTEYETEFNLIEDMENILSVLGYGTKKEDIVKIVKTIKKGLVLFWPDDKDKHEEYVTIELVVDSFSEPAHMKEMGEFVEVELKSNCPSYDSGIHILKNFLRSKGLKAFSKYPPYIEIAINKNNYEKQIENINLMEE